ncbi:MAG: recombinase family protein [Acidimicrobiales bacterium]
MGAPDHRARTREALALKRAAGVRLGRPGLLDPATGARIRDHRAAGATFQAIADELNAEGTTTPSGRPWSPALVRKISLQVPEPAGVTA